MSRHHLAAQELIAKAQQYEGIQAGIVDVNTVLDGPSYRAADQKHWQDDHDEKAVSWLPGARSLLVMAMHHPPDQPQLDWFERGNTAGNRRLQRISGELVNWLLQAHRVHAQPLPYQLVMGGVFLKDAAVMAGLGVIGKNNLLLHPQWGPSLRLRALLIQDKLPSSAPLSDFNPCQGCGEPCRSACPQDAFGSGRYLRTDCMKRLDQDRDNSEDTGQTNKKGNPVMLTKWCRRCELACIAGEH
ncbi:MAG: hypothetical protein K9K65_03535 [Desulfarculaceae bacterium]|nr:hypothetical protein [Desulfarculaceae bacterium]MCF8049205.1 hypothetical protein [Desulfarculaceae bacterium]MCF8065299.1 hypothetical protein [Desulfarculaceae bacterium]MCF8096891.1 hypothetical protein [Desulfarculaceae bacterium]MCF8121664.1 hypothetical protein [Desulfarculaceae bacterium]